MPKTLIHLFRFQRDPDGAWRFRQAPETLAHVNQRVTWVDLAHVPTFQGGGRAKRLPQESCRVRAWLANEQRGLPEKRIYLRNDFIVEQPVLRLIGSAYGFEHLPSAVHFKLRWY